MIPQLFIEEAVVVGSGCHRRKEEEMAAVGWVRGMVIFSLSSTSIACEGEDECGGAG